MVEKGTTKVTWMLLETESLQSEKNLMRIKKALFNFPQIRDQIYDEENNVVTIKVVCCSPEKIMEKLCSKGRGTIKRMKTIEKSELKNVLSKKTEPKEPEKSEPKESKAGPAQPQRRKEPEESKPTPAETGSSSQRLMIQQGYPVPMCMHNGPGPSYGWVQPNRYPERPVYDSYGGGPPPPQFYVQEESSSCRIC